ncbi:MAG: beta-ketoacyl synthase N-terminal-like domain-containing protein [Isosphaeraceae bacterium]|nr:beta-ketoacyl synthase N-terminal-like domain-containing protein [Isosphaeraceae bacterium]
MIPIFITGVGVVTSSGVGTAPLEADLRKAEGEPVRVDSLTRDGRYPYAPLSAEFEGEQDVTSCTVLDRCMDTLLGGAPVAPEFLHGPRTALVLGVTEGMHRRWVPEDGEGSLADSLALSDFYEFDVCETFATTWGLRGPRMAINTACSSSACAFGVAVELIRSGVCDRAVTGGAALLNRFDVFGFRSSRLLAGRSARPFDKRRDGLMLGEGGALILLERGDLLSAAPLAEVASWESNNERHSITAPEPSGRCLAACIGKALAAGGVAVSDVDYVNAHGTGTVANDRSEALGLARLLGSDRLRPLVSSTKGLHGHLRGAGGAVEVVVTMLALQHGFAPVTRGCTDPIEECAWHCVRETPEFREINWAATVSRGFGGTNVAIVLKKCG